jgi:hypothetical protein
MKLSNETSAVLKNFAAINSNIVINPGNEIKTIAEAKNILAKATVTESFDTTFGIYDLNEFLGVTGMFDDPELNIADDSLSINISQDRRAVKYFFSDPSILTSPSKDITMPSTEVTFKLSAEDMASLRRASSTLGVTDVVVESEQGSKNVSLVVTDVKDPTSNSFNIDVGECDCADDAFKFVFNIGNFKFVTGDYEVTISSKLISHFKNLNASVEYWVALEKNSTYGEK